MSPDRLAVLGEAIQRAKARMIELTCTPDARGEIMRPMLLTESLIDELRAKGFASSDTEVRQQ